MNLWPTVMAEGCDTELPLREAEDRFTELKTFVDTAERMISQAQRLTLCALTNNGDNNSKR